MSERTTRRPRRRRGSADLLAEAARVRLARAGSGAAAGWVPSGEPTPPGGSDVPAGRAVAAAVADVPKARLALSPRVVVGVAAVVVVGVLLALLYVWSARPVAEPIPSLRRLPSADPAGAADVDTGTVGGFGPAAGPSAGSGATVVVDVVGAVRRPGVVELPPGARVRDAVAAAGGPSARAQIASVNMARPLVDGEQLVVLRKGAGSAPVVPPVAGSGAGAGAAPGPIDLNGATLEQLDALPGIGPVLAQRILDWRSAHGRFTSVEELTEVSGIGDSTLADLRSRVRV